MLLKLASHQTPWYSPSRRREHRGGHFELIHSIFHEVLTSIVGCVRVLLEMSSVLNQECQRERERETYAISQSYVGLVS